MPPKRKAEVLGEDTKSNATGARKTRSSGPASPVKAATTSKQTRSGLAIAPAEPKKRVYGGKRITGTNKPTKTVVVPDSADESEGELVQEKVAVKVVKAKAAGRLTRGRTKQDVEVEAVSNSSKENTRKPARTTAIRGRTKAKQVEPEAPAVESEDEAAVPDSAAQPPPKRRRTAATSSTKINVEPAVPAKRNTRTTATTSVADPVPSAPAAKPRGKQPKTKTTASKVPAPKRRGRPPKGKEPPKDLVVVPEPPVRKTRGRPGKAKALAPPIPTAQKEGTASPELPLRKPRGRQPQTKAAPSPAPENQDDSESDAEAPPSPLKGRGSARAATRTTSAAKRPRSTTPTPSVNPLPRKRQTTAKSTARVPTPSSLFSAEDNDEHDAASQPEVEVPPSPTKRRVVVVEIEQPKTPKRKRGAAKAGKEPETVPETDEEQDEETTTLPSSPIKQPVFPTTPSRHAGARSVPTSPTKGAGSAGILPPHLIPCLNAQKRAVLRALCNPPAGAAGKAKAVGNEAEEEYDNTAAYEQLKDLLEGTVSRNEGNSCLLLGPRGSGKTRILERCLSELSQSDSNPKPIVIRLSGWVQSSDRLALRQIAIQLAEQTGNSYLSQFNDEKGDEPSHQPQNNDDNPFLDDDAAGTSNEAISLPPSSHLPALIALLPTLKRPTIVVVDAFDLALLYCLLDTGLAVIGLTSRVDVVQLLEKRVKSRFSGRIVRVSNVSREEGWIQIMRKCLLPPSDIPSITDEEDEGRGVEKFLSDPSTDKIVRETYAIVREVRLLVRLLTPVIARLTPSQPYPTPKLLQAAAVTQRVRTPYTDLHTLPYPALCLLIAGYQSGVKGHPVFTFEMLLEAFLSQVRASSAAPILLHGTSIGMVKCSRNVMLSAFESLIASRIFVATAAPSITTPKEYVKYRSVIEREDLKRGIEKTGQVSLKKWWSKA
ncbi:origin recognition complex subunit 4 C-terminus-domain-containing protein [Ephemerocybe angulata]|uniref:Origin recognition complex subunit 4 C-terminus-domain-containing protein n=1 Tax=Ephemerocybe angulata TaxID=980116 RepID=A0A8H6IA66_9AGAR|nr:origin recognition complex subunit 4 C-terminus-domain-containing protein [Tulosesus angulatus]